MTTSAFSIFAIGVFAAVALGIADFLGARASKNVGPLTAACCVQTAGTVAFLVWYLLAADDVPRISTATWLFALSGAVLMALGISTLYLAFEQGPVSLVSPLSAAFPVVTAVVGVVFFHAALSLPAVGAIVVIVLGIMLSSGLLTVGRGERRIGAGPRLALLTTVLWGVAYPLLGQAVNLAGWQIVTLIQSLVMVPALGLAMLVRRRAESLTGPGLVRCLRSPMVIAAGVLQMLAIIAVNVSYGFDQASGTMVVATSATYPVVTMLLALHHFDERTDRIALAGAGLTILGVVALHAF